MTAKLRSILWAIRDVPRPIIRRFRQPEFDEIELVHKLLRPHGPGLMVDVGAHQGGSLRPFAEDGWRVIAVEPDPHNRAVLLRRVAGMRNVLVDGRAVSHHDGEKVALYTSEVSTGISTLAPFHRSHVATDHVETVRLDTLLAEVGQVTVLKTDTEGWDLPVLQTFPWGRLHPLAVICEFEDHKTIPLGYDYHAVARYLADLGYVVFTSEWYPVVEYGRRHRWRSIRRYPVALNDARAWGNLVAVDDKLAEKLEFRVTKMRHQPRQ